MSQKNADSEVKEMSIAEKARLCTSCEEAEENETTEAPDPLAELYGETEIRTELQLDRWDMYAFLMHHSYASLSGVLGILLSLVCIGKAVSEYVGGTASSTTAILLVVGLWFLVINPIMMIGKAAMQIKTNPSLQKAITYTFTEKGLIQEQGEARVGCRWDQMTKVVATKRVWILYTGKMRASVLPVRQFGEHAEELKTLIRQQTGRKR